MITYFKRKNHKSIKKYKNFETLTSIDAVVFIGTTTVSVTFLITGVGLILVPIFAGFACALSLGNKVSH